MAEIETISAERTLMSSQYNKNFQEKKGGNHGIF